MSWCYCCDVRIWIITNGQTSKDCYLHTREYWRIYCGKFSCNFQRLIIKRLVSKFCSPKSFVASFKSLVNSIYFIRLSKFHFKATPRRRPARCGVDIPPWVYNCIGTNICTYLSIRNVVFNSSHKPRNRLCFDVRAKIENLP